MKSKSYHKKSMMTTVFILCLFVLPAVWQTSTSSASRPTDEHFKIVIKGGDNFHQGLIESRLGCDVGIINLGDTAYINLSIKIDDYTVKNENLGPMYQNWSGVVGNGTEWYWHFFIEDNHRVTLVKVTVVINENWFYKIGLSLGPFIFFGPFSYIF